MFGSFGISRAGAPSRDLRWAIKSDPRFREYQERQGTAQVITQFRAAKHLAGFVVEPTTTQTVFMGLWDQLGARDATIDPFSSQPPKPTTVAFSTQLRSEFDGYRGRLVIDWGDGERAWVQRADTQDKPITEIRRSSRCRRGWTAAFTMRLRNT